MAETRPNDPQDPSGSASWPRPDASAGSEPASLVSNRPATGGREAGGPPAAGWQPDPGATDFLGLETDLRGGSSGSGDGPTESWLFDIEQAEGAQPTTALAAPPDGPLEERADGEAEEQGDGADHAPASDDEGELEAASAEDLDPAAARGRGVLRRVLLATAASALLAAGGWYAWYEYGLAGLLRPAEVATTASVSPRPAKPAVPTPRAAPATDNAPDPAPQAADSGSAQGGPEALASATDSGEPAGTAPDSIDPARGASSDPLAAVPGEPSPVVDPWSPRAEPAGGAHASPATDSASPAPSPTVALPPAELARSPEPARAPQLPADAPALGGGRRATAADTRGLWLETTIPSDAIHGPDRLHTVNVGLVRAELVNGEFIEGRLHAVGQSRIWLDVQLGRMSLDAAEVRGMAAISGSTASLSKAGGAALAGLPRVEILLPGGTLTGRVLGRDGASVTFVTEEGMRMRVEPLDVRPAPDGRSRVIGRVGDRAQP